jgi:hypothetical protein
MDSSTTRKQNFDFLFKEFRDARPTLPDRGMLKLFAAHLELSDRYLSHVKCGRKDIGHAVARHIEERSGKEPGWLDQRHQDIDPKDALERNFIETMLAVYRASPVEARQMMTDALKARLSGRSAG